MATAEQINRSSIREHRFTDHGHRRLDPDEVRLAIDFVAMTSNNVTYAVAGDMLDYWGFFPVGEPWGHVPAMGYGTVIESTNDRIEVGSRHFGFFPMANEHIVRAKATDGGFVDIGEHRATHAPAYRQFADVAKDTSYDPDREAHVALLRGLFLTGWLAEDLLFDNDNFGAEATVITSASSKTSIALAWTIAQRGGHAIGLTSARNEAFVNQLGCYAEVIPRRIGSIFRPTFRYRRHGQRAGARCDPQPLRRIACHSMPLEEATGSRLVTVRRWRGQHPPFSLRSSDREAQRRLGAGEPVQR